MDEPMCSEQMQNAMRELQDTMVVMAHIEKAQSEHLGDLVQFRIRTEQNLAEFTDTLNGLMGPKTSIFSSKNEPELRSGRPVLGSFRF
jgi:hypothetical protein